MRTIWILFASLTLVGCATQWTAVIASVPVEKPVVRAMSPTREVETRYDVHDYRDADDPAVRHEAHAVYRVTRVPARVGALDTIPRIAFAPVSYAPLPPSTELAAELGAQKQITTDLRTIRTSMVAVQQQAQDQYGALVNQTADTLKLRRQLEVERARVLELEAKLRERAANPPTVSAVTPVGEPKW